MAMVVRCRFLPEKLAPSQECREWWDEYNEACKTCEPRLRREDDAALAGV